MIITVHSVAQTEALAAWLAAHGPRPAVYLLHGDLGAGKTHFAQGFARGLGITQQVTSPSFALLNRYDVPDADFELFHFDAYRLEDPYFEWEALGFDELVEGDGLCLIEWAERVAGILPATAYDLTIRKDPEDADTRHIELDPRLPVPDLDFSEV